MTTIAFNPNPNTAPPFQATVTLDGQTYSLTAMWSFYRSDWYIVLSDQSGNVICEQPLIGSPPTLDIPLFPGLFTTSQIVYQVASGNFIVTP